MRWFLLLLLSSSASAADSLTQLRATLQKYPGGSPFRVEAALRVREDSQQREDDPRSGSVTFDAEDGPSGFSIHIARPVVEQTEREAADKKSDPDRLTPTRTAMVAMTIFDVMDALNAAKMLLTDLDGATIVNETATQYGGAPAMLLKVKVRPTLAGTRSRLVKAPQIELTIWLDSDGLPLAAERKSNYAAGVLMVNVQNSRKETWRLAVHGDRIYAQSGDEENRASGLGKTFVTFRAVTYQPR
jgi:hypothetical protein